MREHRIAAGGIVLKNEAILLVRYESHSGSYLAGPGGALEHGENAAQAIEREVLEETGVLVHPRKVLIIEDLQCSRFKMCKIWMLCDVIGGDIRETQGAKEEGITEVRWFTKQELKGEIVYPPPVMQHEWNEFRPENWQVLCPPSRVADF